MISETFPSLRSISLIKIDLDGSDQMCNSELAFKRSSAQMARFLLMPASKTHATLKGIIPDGEETSDDFFDSSGQRGQSKLQLDQHTAEACTLDADAMLHQSGEFAGHHDDLNDNHDCFQ